MLLLGIDIGTSHTKAVVVARDGREVASSAVATPFVGRDGRTEMSVDALRGCLGDVLAPLGDRRRQVVAAGVAGIAESGAPFDAGGRPLAPVIAWTDERGHEAVAALARQFGPALPARIGQEVRTVLTVSKLGWLVSNGMTGMARWLGVPELALHALTGEAATEVSLAARTGAFDVISRNWIPEVPTSLGFSIGAFPPVCVAGAAMGRVSGPASGWSGLPRGIPVTIAGHDHLVGMAGAGAGPGDAANSVGTAETIVVRAPGPPDVAAALAAGLRVSVHPGGEEWAVLVGAARAGLVLEAAAARLGRALPDLDRAAAGEPVAHGTAAGEPTASGTAAGEPTANGTAAGAGAGPAALDGIVDGLARGIPVVFPAVADGTVWAGLLRALAARTADAYRRLVQVVGPCLRLVVYGGGAASDPWLRAKAAALTVPVVRSDASAVARGAALYAGVAAGWWATVDGAPAPSLVPVGRP